MNKNLYIAFNKSVFNYLTSLEFISENESYINEFRKIYLSVNDMLTSRYCSKNEISEFIKKNFNESRARDYFKSLLKEMKS